MLWSVLVSINNVVTLRSYASYIYKIIEGAVFKIIHSFYLVLIFKLLNSGFTFKNCDFKDLFFNSNPFYKAS